MQKANRLFFCCVFLFAYSCHTSYQTQSVQYKDYRIAKTSGGDAQLNDLIKPYADSVNKSMNDVIAVADITLEKKQPEGTLGNLMVDIMLAAAKEKYQTNVDAAIINDGGIRLPSIAAGNITRGKVFELSPFDNIIVLQKLTGTALQNLLDFIAARRGWPVAGITFHIKNKKAIDVKVKGSPIDMNTTYTIAILDYIANGGDDAAMLKTIPQVNNGYIFRDALIEYMSKMKIVSSKIENRVSNVE